MGVFSSVTAGLYYSSVILMDLIPKAKTNYVIAFCAIACFLITDLLMGIEVKDILVLKVIIGLMIFFMFIFPVLSLSIAFFKRRLKNEENNI